MKQNLHVYMGLHILLLVYSASTVFSKLASGYSFLSYRFLLCYGMVLLLLGAYAVFWQQIIKRLPLMTAYANKAVTVVWGIVWGALIFREEITWGKVFGAVLVIAGVMLYVSGDHGDDQEAAL
ncbi:MAG: EamA family transporter [Lachnospiraceae bacterium]|nr:EamA family transporter [Lachnospiraceae bacterium]